MEETWTRLPLPTRFDISENERGGGENDNNRNYLRIR